MRYLSYADYMKKKYGQKIYKLPVSLAVSCPNREDGQAGCTFCGAEGAGFENLSSALRWKNSCRKIWNILENDTAHGVFRRIFRILPIHISLFPGCANR